MVFKWNRTGVMVLACLGGLVFSSSCMKRSTKDTKAKKEQPAGDQETSEAKADPVDSEIRDPSSSAEGGSATSAESAASQASRSTFPSDPYGALDQKTEDDLDGTRDPYAEREEGLNGSNDRNDRPEEMDQLVGDWSGVNNEADPEGVWEVVSADSGSGESDASGKFFDRSGDEVDCLSPEAERSDARTFVFVIKQGAGVNGWNQRNNPCLVKAGRTLKFVNEDDTPHIPHFNGEICQHPDPTSDVMEKGTNNNTYTCTPQQPTRLIQTYDHLAGQDSPSQLYIQVIP